MTDTSGRRQELVAIVSLLAGIFVALTLLPWDITGPVGRIAGEFLWKWFGLGAVLIPVLGVGVGLAGFGLVPRLDLERVAVLCAGLVLLVPYAVAIVAGATGPGDFPPAYEDWTTAQKLAGLVPVAIAVGIGEIIGTAGAVIVGLGGLWVLTVYTLGLHPFAWMPRAWERIVGAVHRVAERAGRRGEQSNREDVSEPREVPDEDSVSDDSSTSTIPPPPPTKSRKRRKTPEQTELPIADGASVDDLPPVDILTSPVSDSGHDFEDAIERLGHVLIETLRTFKVEGSIVGRTTGPVVTQYEVAPAPGVKVGRIAALADDLALAMRAQSVRIVAPIPGRGAVGVEVPNPQPRIVTLRELLEMPEWIRARGILPVALGRNLEGRPIVADLAKMPHLLIAGATGSGKSICINSIITSLMICGC
jgi:S-DNA-T family DNA segregation ATPase FtsK/SpoIIIE